MDYQLGSMWNWDMRMAPREGELVEIGTRDNPLELFLMVVKCRWGRWTEDRHGWIATDKEGRTGLLTSNVVAWRYIAQEAKLSPGECIEYPSYIPIHSLNLWQVREGYADPSTLAKTYEHGCPNCGTCRDQYSTFWSRLLNVFKPNIPKAEY